MDVFGMQDLLQGQIQGSCRLSLPDGLQDLMYDISREVLRAQPEHLYAFISNYLAALLVTRENLAVATRVCSEVCDNICHLGLKDELLEIGLSQQEVDDVKNIVEEYFSSGEVKEGNLLMKLMKKTEIDEDLLPEIQNAIRRAFMRYQAHNTTVYESSSDDGDMDEVSRAARHTIKLYRHSKPTVNDMERAAIRIQTAYRAYVVRRAKTGDIRSPAKPQTKNIRFGVFESFGSVSDECSLVTSSKIDDEEDNPPYYPPPEHTTSYTSEISKVALSSASVQFKDDHVLSISSSSLAGSFLKLPKHVPYSAHHDTLRESEEDDTERENTTIDYTTIDESKGLKKPAKKTISFPSIHEVINDKISIVIEEGDKNIKEPVLTGSEVGDPITEVIDQNDKSEITDVSERTDLDDKGNETDDNNEIMEEYVVEDDYFNDKYDEDRDNDLSGNENEDFVDGGDQIAEDISKEH